MNYIELINNAWELREQGVLDKNDFDLYLYLVHRCNRLSWKNPFNLQTSVICAILGINREALGIRRNKLAQAGLIAFKQGVRQTQPAEYKLRCTLKRTPNRTPDSTPDSTPERTYTKNKNKTIKKEVKKAPQKEAKEKKENALRFPYTSERFIAAWSLLVATPKWKKKIPHSLQLALNKLSKYDEEFAIMLMENATAGGWQGIVFTNTNEEYEKWKTANSRKDLASSSGAKDYSENSWSKTAKRISRKEA